MRLTVLHNPTSGDAPISGAALRSMLDAAGYQVHYVSTDGPWEKALQRPADLVVAAGGDGTVRKVVVALAGTGMPLGVLPTGTANNIAKSLGILGSVDEIVRSWRRTRPRPFDIGVISAAPGEDRFVEGFGGGVFAHLIAGGTDHARRTDAFVGRETDRVLNLFAGILERAEPGRWELRLDGADLSGSYLAVEVLNTRFGGPNIPLAPAAHVGDGRLDVVLIGARDRRSLLSYVRRRLELGSGIQPALRIHRGRHLRAIPPASVELHLDDRPWPADDGRGASRDRSSRAIDILVRPGAARVVCPATGGRRHGPGGPSARSAAR